MTRRERLEAKMERREQWAEGRAKKAAESFSGVRRIADAIPFGQPILVGHHSERHARKDAERIHNGMARAVEHQQMAQHHAASAAGIERQLKNSVFSDDPDAVEALEAKIAKAEELQARMKMANAVIRKHAKAGRPAQQAALEHLGFTEEQAVGLLTPDFAGRLGFPSFASTNNGANIRRMKARVAEVQARQERTAKAELAGVLIEGAGDHIRVTFPDKPASEVLEALRAAGFWWRGGSWCGKREALPAAVTETANAAPVSE